MKNDIDNETCLQILDIWERSVFENEESFLGTFACANANILTQISWDTNFMRIVYIVEDGAHIGDSVEIAKWLEWYNNKNG